MMECSERCGNGWGKRCADRMSGRSPLGYDARDKKLVLNPDDAETVGTLFRLYLELGRVK